MGARASMVIWGRTVANPEDFAERQGDVYTVTSLWKKTCTIPNCKWTIYQTIPRFTGSSDFEEGNWLSALWMYI